MNWKNVEEFLKPDWRKIAVFAIIFIATILSAQATSYPFIIAEPEGCMDCGGGGWEACRYDLLIPIWPFMQFVDGDILNSKTFFCPLSKIYTWVPGTSQLFLIVLTPHLVYWYLLSCLLIWIYIKVKKK